MKSCSKCGIEKSLDKFSNRKLSKDGKVTWCKECMKEYRGSRPILRVESKICSQCEELLPATAFSKNKGTANGLYSICKECRKPRAQKYYLDNPEKMAARREKAKNSPEVQAVSKKRREKNKEHLKAETYRWREENPEKWKAIDRESRKRNRHSRNAKRKIIARSPVSYETYENKLTPDEQTYNSDGLLGVKCFYCGKDYLPSLAEVGIRISALKKISTGEGHIYCSENCKASCSTFNRVLYPAGHGDQGTSRELQPWFRKKVLRRDNWACQKCGATDKPLHAHHIEPHRLEYDSMHEYNGITLCQECHQEVHRQKGCSSRDIAKLC